jgi:hypothetical protein
MKDLNQVRMITLNFPFLQGLKLVPLGLLLAGVSLWANAGSGPRRDLFLPVLGMGLAALAYGLISRYYARNFGVVKPARAQRRSQLWRGLAGGAAGLAAFWLDVTFKFPLSFIGLVLVGGGIYESLFIWRQTGARVETVNLGVAVCLAALSLLPLAGVNWWQALGIRSHLIGMTTAAGALFVLLGVWEHFRLVHLMPEPREAGHGQRI